MSLERVRLLVERYRERLSAPNPKRDGVGWSLAPRLGVELMESMLLARHLDRAAHELRASGHGHYTICSSGHEANVVLGRLTHPTDPALLHYRSAALQLERARHVPEVDGVSDILLSLVASKDEPASGGRHKVFGNRKLGIIPQTSTIASHLPRAVGLAFALERRARLGLAPESDAIVVCSFGDASVNHSTALGALNAASWVVHQNLKLPVLFVCEDNGLGISVRTPPGWIAERARALPHISCFGARGWDLAEVHRTAERAIAYCRATRRPAFLHVECVRLLGHAGSDVDTSYRSSEELEAVLERDPVLCHALSMISSGAATPQTLLELDTRAAARVDGALDRARTAARLTKRAEVMGAIARDVPPRTRALGEGQRSVEPWTLAQGINRALAELLQSNPGALVFGEDVARKGGVYGVTKGLLDRFGPLRVFNTLLDEQTILGLALGAATLGLLPIAELQYLAYLHNAEDQLRGEAATFRFFSNGAYENPLIVRIAGLAYQKGFGGHFHNDNSLAVLRDIPGLVVAVPARADDALALYRCSNELVEVGRVVVIVEPIALYHRRDLRPGDGRWLATDSGETADFGRARLYRPEGAALTILTYGNGVAFALSAAERLETEYGVGARVLDLRWLCPLPEEDILGHARATGRVLIVDECRKSGNVSEALAALLMDQARGVEAARVTSADSFIPLGDAADLVLLNEDEIIAAAIRLVRR
ncbi:MAG TPA: thiamine pyrophosphate-dependent enzyme [Polyangiaceae bacterium]